MPARGAFLRRLGLRLIGVLVARRAARGETLPSAAEFLTRVHIPDPMTPVAFGHIDVWGPDGSHADTYADIPPHDDIPFADHSDNPYTDHSDSPYTDNPYTDTPSHDDTPHGDS
jgi:hypothetical protein